VVIGSLRLLALIAFWIWPYYGGFLSGRRPG